MDWNANVLLNHITPGTRRLYVMRDGLPTYPQSGQPPWIRLFPSDSPHRRSAPKSIPPPLQVSVVSWYDPFVGMSQYVKPGWRLIKVIKVYIWTFTWLCPITFWEVLSIGHPGMSENLRDFFKTIIKPSIHSGERGRERDNRLDSSIHIFSK